MCPFFRKRVQSVLSTFSALFRLHNPPFVNIIFCIFRTVSLILSNDFLRLHKIPVLSSHKKSSFPARFYLYSEPTKKKPSLLLFILFPASIPVTAAGITAAVSYNKNPLIYYTKSFCFPRLYSRLTGFSPKYRS